MKKVIMNFVFAAVLFFTAVTAAYCAVSSYNVCRCKQESPGISDQFNVCCQSLAEGNTVSSVVNAQNCCFGKGGGYGDAGDARCCTGTDAGKKWTGNGCVTEASSCTSTYGTWSYGDWAYPVETYYDTCNGKPLETFTCTAADSGTTCTDFTQTGACPSTKKTQWGAWGTVSDTEQFSSRPSSTCMSSTVTYMKNNWITPSQITTNQAIEACKTQCNASIGGTTPCASSCRVIGNCWTNPSGAGVYCEVRDIDCTVKDSKVCSVGYRSVKCC
ncbi:MAG: hypothetical protein LBI01_05380 [Elusimicrobium sp.]|nr:hypothetical protein [Elusimicrobium sp.]